MLSPRLRKRHGSQRGAIAVLFAVVCVLLFTVAALSIDLGNAFSRKRDVQSAADFAALAGGAELPDTVNAVKAVSEYLNRNQAQSDGEACSYTNNCVTEAQLTDGSDSNGEVYFTGTDTMRVVTPRSHVQFGLAKAVGFNDLNVGAQATVRIGSPGKFLPFFLPKDCTTGPVDLKDSASVPAASTFVPASGTSGLAKIDSVTPLTVPGLVTSTLKVYGSKFGNPMVADFFQVTTGDRVPVDTTKSVPMTRLPDEASNEVATVDLPAGVFNRPGQWYIRVDNGNGYSKDLGLFTVGNPTPPAAGCGMKATGDFGLLDSPRKVGTPSVTIRMNIALGLDHLLDLFPSPPYPLPAPTNDSCNGNGGTPPPGAVNDKTSVDGNNCVDIENGMDTDAVTDGLIKGGTDPSGNHFKGLLDKDTLTNCDRNGGSDEKTRLGIQTNDDVLSCFLKPGIKVGDVTGPTIPASAVGSIDSRIFDSPRFAVVPVINFPLNPINGFYPLVDRIPVFITDESAASVHGTSYASSSNGITVNNAGNKVIAVTVVPINFDALPKTAGPSGPLGPYLGKGTKVVTLVN